MFECKFLVKHKVAQEQRPSYTLNFACDMFIGVEEWKFISEAEFEEMEYTEIN